MKKDDDLSPAHLRWLVSSRSENQKCSLELYELMKDHSAKLRKALGLSDIAQGLVASSFSLWRAVFLGDKQGGHEEVLGDAEHFLGKLILDNAIAYPQDRNTREWTFQYYVNNARYRLEMVSTRQPRILPNEFVLRRNRNPKAQWSYYQSALSHAIPAFSKLLAEV